MLARNIPNRIYSVGTHWVSRVRSLAPFSRRRLAYAAVNHAVEYKTAMEGRHGAQLELAHKEGDKYDIEPLNPFDKYRIDDDSSSIENKENMNVEEHHFDEENSSDSDDDEGEDAQPTKSHYNRDGSRRRTRAELAKLNAGAPSGGNFAIILLNGTQEKVCVDDMVIMNKLNPVDKWAVGSIHTLNSEEGQILLLGNQEKTLVGLPFVNGAEVDVMVEEITHDKKVIVFKKKRRKNYRRKNGFKRQVTFLRVLDIRFPNEIKVE